MRAFYNLLLMAFFALASPFFLAAAVFSAKRRGTVLKRMGFQTLTDNRLLDGVHRPVWIHALSVGEVLSAVELAVSLKQAFPGRPIVFSATTKTGIATAESRLTGIAAGIIDQSPYTGRFGRVPSTGTEVNGEFLQVLTRLAWRTNDPWFVENALKIADFYFRQVIPGCQGGIPADNWDIGKGAPEENIFRFSDHGNEIAGGLSELALYLVEKGVKLVGIDYLSVDAYNRPDAPVHRTLLRAGIVILEGLHLLEVPPGAYQIFCLPLRLAGGDGAPARVVLREE